MYIHYSHIYIYHNYIHIYMLYDLYVYMYKTQSYILFQTRIPIHTSYTGQVHAASHTYMYMYHVCVVVTSVIII